MRELNLSKQKPAARNRIRKQRKKLDIRGFLKKIVRGAAAVVVLSLVSLVSFELYELIGKTTFLDIGTDRDYWHQKADTGGDSVNRFREAWR